MTILPGEAPCSPRGLREPVRPLTPGHRLALILCITNGATLALGWIVAGQPSTSFFPRALLVGLGGCVLGSFSAPPGKRLQRFGTWAGCVFSANAACSVTRACGELGSGAGAQQALGHLALGVLFLGLAALPLLSGRIYPSALVLSHELADKAGGLQRGRPPRRVILRLEDGRAIPAVVKSGFHLTKLPAGVTASMVVDVTAELPRARWRT